MEHKISGLIWLTTALCLAGASAEAREVSFNKDVLPILQNRCQACHRPGEAAPMSLLTYKEARPWAKAIREVVLEKKMPPWFADPRHGRFANNRLLFQQEIDTLVAWADTGAREGNLKDAPAPLKFTDGWTIGTPDAILEMSNDFHVPASGIVEYQYILVPTGFVEDRWVEKVEMRPGNRAVVHHAVAFAREPGSKFVKNLKPGVPFGPPERKFQPAPDNGAGVFGETPGAEILAVYVPGGGAYQLNPGQARLIKAGSDLVFQIHYTTNGVAAADRSRVGIVFAKGAPKERVRNMFVANLNLRIPPGAGNHRVEARVKLHETVRLVSLFPHMHVRGRSFEYRAIYPTGESEILLNVPKYDFNWQLTYYLDQPRTLPKGTVLECIAHFDNSRGNPFNPDPKAEVLWGEQTWEEMLAGFVDLAFDVGMDPLDLIRPRKGPSIQTNDAQRNGSR